MKALIELREEGFPILTYTDDAGGVIEKEILPDTLYQLIGDSIMEPDWIETPLLPSGCIRYAQQGTQQKFLIYVPQGGRDTWLYNQRIKDLPFPHLIFGFVLEERVVVRKYVVAVKESLLTNETELYRYPYSNVYQDARTCWDGLPEIQEVFQIGTLPELFFASPDNGHLYERQGYRELLERSQGKQFPYDTLIERGETLADLWARL
jgi:hypothetical protein